VNQLAGQFPGAPPPPPAAPGFGAGVAQAIGGAGRPQAVNAAGRIDPANAVGWLSSIRTPTNGSCPRTGC
jgi:hypothetical protein